MEGARALHVCLTSAHFGGRAHASVDKKPIMDPPPAWQRERLTLPVPTGMPLGGPGRPPGWSAPGAYAPPAGAAPPVRAPATPIVPDIRLHLAEPQGAEPQGAEPPHDEPAAGAPAARRPRKLGKTCGECRRQHLACDYSTREELARAERWDGPVVCTRCAERRLECAQIGMSPRYFPRPSRTGKRIELGRQLHGSAVYAEAPSSSDSDAPGPQLSSHLFIVLLRTYYMYMHSHFPVIEYERFSEALNYSKGNVEVMARLLDGRTGDDATRRRFLRGLLGPGRDAQPGQVANAGTCETLLCMLIACGAQQTALPLEQLGTEPFARIDVHMLARDLIADPSIGVARAPPIETVHMGAEGTRKRQKRRQGVACDTCRLRRVRCDLMEQPPGVKACSRCRVKRVACTDRYIQWKRQRDIQRQQSASDADPDLYDVPAALEHIGLLPPLEDFGYEALTPTDVVCASQLEMIDHGRARSDVVGLLLNRVLLLLHQHDLLHTSNVQSVQTLLLLSSTIDYDRRELATEALRVACIHAKTLGMHAEFDMTHATDPAVVVRLLDEIQDGRLVISLFVRESIMCLTLRCESLLDRDCVRIVERADGASAPHDVSIDRVCEIYHQTRSDALGAFLYYMTSAFLARLSRSLIQDMFPLLQRDCFFTTAANVAHIRRLCEHAWHTLKKIDELHFTAMRDAREMLVSIRPIILPMWSYMIVELIALVHINLTKRLREWHMMNSTVIAEAYAKESESVLETEELRQLIATSQHHTLVACRRVAWAVHAVLPCGMMLRATTVSRQLFNVAQFLTRTPSVEAHDEETPHATLASHTHSTKMRNSNLAELLNPPNGERVPSPKEEPQEPSMDTIMRSYDTMSEIPSAASIGPYSVEAKRIEVGWCIEALGQIGYAFTGVDTEIQRLVDLFKAVE